MIKNWILARCSCSQEEVNDILTSIVNSVYGVDDDIMVYTLSGMGQKMKKSDLRSLPKGIYIINGWKYVVK